MEEGLECGFVKELLKFEKKFFGVKWVIVLLIYSFDLVGKCEVMNEVVNCVVFRR